MCAIDDSNIFCTFSATTNIPRLPVVGTSVAMIITRGAIGDDVVQFLKSKKIEEAAALCRNIDVQTEFLYIKLRNFQVYGGRITGCGEWVRRDCVRRPLEVF